MECTAASGYFVKRRHRVSDPWKTVVYHHYPKLGVVCDTNCHFILGIGVGRGPRPDVDELVPLLTNALLHATELPVGRRGLRLRTDDRFAREQCGCGR